MGFGSYRNVAQQPKSVKQKNRNAEAQGCIMLTETKLRSLKPRERLYKVADRDGMYVAVLPSGALSFRYNYMYAGKQKTLIPNKNMHL